VVNEFRKPFKGIAMKNLIKMFLSLTLTFIFLLQFDAIRVTSIYFFDGIYLLIIASIINYLIFRNKMKNVLILVITVFSMNFGFFVLLPVSYERSVSVELLTNLSNESINSELTKDDIRNEIIKITSTEEFTNKRIEEQLYTGYIEKTDNGYTISQTIKNFLTLKNFISTIFNIGI
tara:strand:+ start:9938 stop:10465 length:528 start_codon:yes stop_codon:yes gene_type:complete